MQLFSSEMDRCAKIYENILSNFSTFILFLFVFKFNYFYLLFYFTLLYFIDLFSYLFACLCMCVYLVCRRKSVSNLIKMLKDDIGQVILKIDWYSF